MADGTSVAARRALVLAGLLAMTLALSGCGDATRAAHPGRVRVNFCTLVSMPECKAGATPAQEAAVGRALRKNPHVVKIVFVSKTAELQRFHKENPGLPIDQLPSNPLPDEWLVMVDSDQDNGIVGKAICAAHYPGVEPCPAPRSHEYGKEGGVTWSSGLFGGPLRWPR